MKYYKLILDNQVIGAITSNNFIEYIPITGCFIISNETDGEYIDYNGQFYRSTWMKPAKGTISFTLVQVIEIEEDEYNTYVHALETNKIIKEEREEELPEVKVYIAPEDIASIDFIKSSKIDEMSRECRKTIEAGFDIELREQIHHFSLNTQDQLNLMNLGLMAQTQTMIPYHADGEECIFYTNEEINEIIDSANALKLYNTTYFNALKNYINSLDTIEEISAVTYGILIPDEYKTDVLKFLEQ